MAPTGTTGQLPSQPFSLQPNTNYCIIWLIRWVQSEFSGKEFGKFDWTAGKWYGDVDKDKGIKTSEDARFYGISAKFEDSKFSNDGKDLIVQFSGNLDTLIFTRVVHVATLRQRLDGWRRGRNFGIND